jgi:hypothetical protein
VEVHGKAKSLTSSKREQKEIKKGAGEMAHDCNPSYLGSGDGSMEVGGKKLTRLSQRTSRHGCAHLQSQLWEAKAGGLMSVPSLGKKLDST